jgi:hypothetical protein
MPVKTLLLVQAVATPAPVLANLYEVTAVSGTDRSTVQRESHEA